MVLCDICKKEVADTEVVKTQAQVDAENAKKRGPIGEGVPVADQGPITEEPKAKKKAKKRK